MKPELVQIVNFLASHPPFDELPESALSEIANETEVAYYRAESDILRFAEPIQDLYVIRSGAVETYRRSGQLYNRLDEGNVFGQMGLLMNRRVRFPVKAIQDTLLYCIPATIFSDYCDRFESFAEFFESENSTLLRQAVASQSDSNDMTSVKVKSLMLRDPICIAGHLSVEEAAQIMTEERVSSLLITHQDLPQEQKDRNEAADDDDDEQTISGIITDRDFRRRILATGKSPAIPVEEVMSRDVATIDSNAYVYEAMLTMLRCNIQHLPVVHNRQLAGIVSMSDIVRHESKNSLLLVRGIFAQTNIDDLKSYANQVPSVFVRMVNEDANSHMIGSAMAVIGRSFKQRLLQLAEEKLGPPPVPYCFLALGSMARDEQLIVTDQDNAIIIGKDYDPALHDDYFTQLSEFVCEGLAACGYKLCSGDIMATNPKWRMTLEDWKACFASWIEKPTPKALLNSSIFFDLDGVYGTLGWARQLQKFISLHAKASPRFLACLARNALNRTPPLGFFKSFVMEQDGQHKNSINLKRRGTAPLSDVIRVHALASGSRAQNSFERLEDIDVANLVPPGKGQDMSDALEYISMVRIRHQAKDVEAGIEPDNNIEPDKLSTFERRNLKEAFRVIVNAQSFLKFRYHASLPST